MSESVRAWPNGSFSRIVKSWLWIGWMAGYRGIGVVPGRRRASLWRGVVCNARELGSDAKRGFGIRSSGREAPAEPYWVALKSYERASFHRTNSTAGRPW
jgi:hypothetical protein